MLFDMLLVLSMTVFKYVAVFSRKYCWACSGKCYSGKIEPGWGEIELGWDEIEPGWGEIENNMGTFGKKILFGHKWAFCHDSFNIETCTIALWFIF